MRYRNLFFLTIALAVTAGLLLPAGMVLLADPFRIYHQALFPEQAFSSVQRYQHAGLINTYLARDPAFNTVLIGSSTSANFHPSDMEQYWGKGHALNLSINGSNSAEQTIVARHALATGHVSLLVWDLHPVLFSIDSGPGEAMPAYLYNNNLLDDGPYLFNADNLLTAFRFIQGTFTGFDKPFDDIGGWYEGMKRSGRFETNTSEEFMNTDLRPKTQETLDALKVHRMPTLPYSHFQYETVDRNLLSVIMPLCNSPTEVRLFFTPLSQMLYARQGSSYPFAFYRYLYMRRYILEQIAPCKNIGLWSFDTERWITWDLGNYIDNVHYTTTINQHILQSLANGEHRLNLDTVGDFETRFDHDSHAFMDAVVNGTLPPSEAVYP